MLVYSPQLYSTHNMLRKNIQHEHTFLKRYRTVLSVSYQRWFLISDLFKILCFSHLQSF